MSLKNLAVEQGFEIDGGGALLSGNGAPTGTSGPTDDAAIGSLYMDQAAGGALYKKQADTSSASDWERVVDETIYTALGITFGDVDMGAYTGEIITDNTSQSAINQELSDAIEAVSGGTSSEDTVPAATPTTVNTCLVDECNYVEYECWVYETGDESNREAFKVTMFHDGTTSADATAIDETVHTKLKLTGSDVSGLTFTGVLSGTGAAQTLGLQISATAEIKVFTRRTGMPT